MLSFNYPTDMAKSWLDIVVWIGGLITAIVGVWRGVRQANRANEIRRAELLRDLLNQYYGDEISNSIKAIDEGKIVFSNSKTLILGDEQKKSVTLAEPALLFFSNLCYLKDVGLMRPKEFEFFEWRLKKIMSNKCVSDYVGSLSEEHKGVAMKRLLAYSLKQ